MVIAIQLTNASSVRGFEAALDTVAGRTSVEIVGTAGVPESEIPALGWLREFGTFAPVIEGEMAIVTEEMLARGPTMRSPTGVPVRPVRRSEAVKVLGVDILRDLDAPRLRGRRAAGDEQRTRGDGRRRSPRSSSWSC